MLSAFTPSASFGYPDYLVLLGSPRSRRMAELQPHDGNLRGMQGLAKYRYQVYMR